MPFEGDGLRAGFASALGNRDQDMLGLAKRVKAKSVQAGSGS